MAGPFQWAEPVVQLGGGGHCMWLAGNEIINNLYTCTCTSKFF